ncbi:MAG: tRNA (N6-isopentenyl adenosine(37)-C2)-methylthiotransferase MiaB [Oscillospiraceae bacterium]|nr:tRNA (N6-isopentenyl adenosine(37)-C2)-methylthiotransferase MiaB [Oscillospiraceae bacterium]
MDEQSIIAIKEINEKKPSKPKACVVTFGCQQNVADSEKIKGMLELMGYETIDADMTDDIAGNFGQFDEKSILGSCDAIILNTCAVREHAELKAFSRTGQLKHYKNKNKDMLIGLCGCMPEQKHALEYIKKSYRHVDFVFGTRSIHKFPEIFYETLANKKKIIQNEPAEETIDEQLPVKRDSLFLARVSAMYGCDNFCSYCVVPNVRGRERSRSKDKILEEICGLVLSGYKDITLLGQNVNSYKDPENPGYGFARLLGDITKIEGDYWIRFLTSHPKDVPDELINLMGESDKIARHFHLPVQAGSDRILKLMNRKYTQKNYLELIEKLKKNVKDIAIASDIIVGFPSETEEDFRQTLDIIEKAQFDQIFPFIYSKRENTPAAEMEDKTPRKEKTERFMRLVQMQNLITEKKNKAYEGKTVKVLVDGEHKNSDGGEKKYMAGRTTAHKLAIFEGGPGLVGRFVDVKINSGKLHGLYGDISPAKRP